MAFVWVAFGPKTVNGNRKTKLDPQTSLSFTIRSKKGPSENATASVYRPLARKWAVVLYCLALTNQAEAKTLIQNQRRLSQERCKSVG